MGETPQQAKGPPQGEMSEEERQQTGADVVVQLADELMGEGLEDAAALTDVSAAKFVARARDGSDEILGEVRPERETLEAAQHWRKALRRRTRVRAGSVALGALSIGLAASAIGGGFVVTPAVFSGIFGASAILAELRSARRVDAASRAMEGRAQTTLPAKEQEREARAAYDAALRGTVESWLAEQINLELGEIYAAALPELNPSALAEIDDPEREIPTQAREDLESLIGRMPGGSVGLAGPRGVGKSTLIRRITTWGHAPEADGLPRGIVVDAPVQYEAREFVLHLFASLCEAVLGPSKVASLRGWDVRSQRATLAALRTPLSNLGALLLGIGGIVYLAIVLEQGGVDLSDFRTLALVAVGVGVGLIYVSLLTNARATASWIREVLRELRPFPPGKDPIALAETRLRQIWFQRSFSSGWSGALKLPLGLQVGTDATTQLSENQLTLADIVRLYKEFVGALSLGGPVRIGIDELDKMEDEDARRFLNEIKVIFRIERCFYLVSVSEDAMSDFERRGLPFRDVFDSSFDEVLKVGYLPFEGTHRLLRRRVVGLPLQFIGLCHVLGGGLARDVIREARQVCERERGETLEHVVEEICHQQLLAKCDAAKVATRRLRNPRYVAELSHWLATLRLASIGDGIVLDVCGRFESDFIGMLGAPDRDPDAARERLEALSIGTEMVTFAYFIVTAHELFGGLATESATKEAISSRTLDGLAQARQAFSVNTVEAWEATSGVRITLGAEKLRFPDGVSPPEQDLTEPIVAAD